MSEETRGGAVYSCKLEGRWTVTPGGVLVRVHVGGCCDVGLCGPCAGACVCLPRTGRKGATKSKQTTCSVWFPGRSRASTPKPPRASAGSALAPEAQCPCKRESKEGLADDNPLEDLYTPRKFEESLNLSKTEISFFS
jgi:hypothetical protein